MADQRFENDRLATGEERLLVARAADGDTAAIERLYDAYERKLFNYCHRITGNREDSADATQEAFCNVISRLPGLDVDKLKFGAFLFTTARNACLDLIQQSRRAEPTEEVPEDQFAVAPVEIDPERALLTADQQRAAREANNLLPEKQRAVLALREVAELSYDDIAQTMQMNSNAVARLISRARLNFFKQLRSAAVVIPSLDEAGRRAIELVSARQDGRIADDELSWLEQHLRHNESSRINAEAVQEATVLYRAIGPVAVIAALKGEAIARASEMVSQQLTKRKGTAHSSPADGFTVILPAAGGETAAASSKTQHHARVRPGATRKGRIVTIASLTILATISSLALVATLGDSTISFDEPSGNAPVSTAGDGHGKSTKRSRGKSNGNVAGPAAVLPLLSDKVVGVPVKRKSTTRRRIDSPDRNDSNTTPAPPSDPAPPAAPTPDPTPDPQPPSPTPPITQPTPPVSVPCFQKPCPPIRPPIP
ncbi:MAG TPA: sigma-70 family RNA polymerase sigma factor [Solirubrobacterales bacterium]|jgi:RNA polymerase sigma-70 factor (ECF subfamily)|nr:sigma-70 family RNA polymerase sigma factor [Solirubrobacterales bacterium]